MRFEWHAKAIKPFQATLKRKLYPTIHNAIDVVLLISVTSFNGFDKCPDKDGKMKLLKFNVILIRLLW